jgi:ubiquinone/menaquinone biosynthesis C-methylase UbiE
MQRNDIFFKNRNKFAVKWHPVISKIRDGVSIEQVLDPSKTSVEIENAGIQRLFQFIKNIQGQAYPEAQSSLHTEITQKMLENFLKKYRIPKDAKILDVGCGQAPAMDILRSMNFKTVGITIDDEDIKVCRQKGHEVYKMDQSFLNFPDDSFEFIWARHCIEHSIFPFFTLSEFFRVLKPGYYLYLEVPAPDTSCKHETNLNHYSVLSKSMWSSLINRTGFIILEQIDLTFTVLAGPDQYWTFICQKPSENQEYAHVHDQARGAIQ